MDVTAFEKRNQWPVSRHGRLEQNVVSGFESISPCISLSEVVIQVDLRILCFCLVAGLPEEEGEGERWGAGEVENNYLGLLGG